MVRTHNNQKANVMLQLALGMALTINSLPIAHVKASDDPHKRVEELTENANAESLKHNYTDAIKYYQLALAETEKLPEQSRTAKQKLILLRMGSIYKDTRQLPLAEKTYELLLALERKKATHQRLEGILTMLASVYQQEGKLEQAKALRSEGDRLKLADSKASFRQQEPAYLADVREAEKQGGKALFRAKRELGRFYMAYGQTDKAESIYRDLMLYCQDPKNYIDPGKDSENRVEHAVPMQDVNKTNGQTLPVPVTPGQSAKLDKHDLLEILMILSEMEKGMQRKEAAQRLSKQAKDVYDELYPDASENSFEKMCKKYSWNPWLQE